MSLTDLEAITATDTKGPNENADKAKRLRSFVVPPSMIVDDSSPNLKRTINILLAIVMEDGTVFTIVDFSRMARLNFISKDRHWIESDFELTSEVCSLHALLQSVTQGSLYLVMGNNLGRQ